MRGAERATAGAPADAELMRRTALGDREAFATVYRRYHGIVYRFARLMTGSTSAAEDIVQEVFLVVMRDAGRYNATRAALATYLYGVARHQTRRRLARDWRFVTFDGNGTDATAYIMDDDPSASIERREALQRLRRAIVSLPRKYREVIVLCDLQDVTYADASAVLGCAIGTIRSRLHRARHRLGQKIAGADASDGDRERLAMRCAT
jgi:RNA polymerase sigma-70 factor (ECF subfamily)